MCLFAQHLNKSREKLPKLIEQSMFCQWQMSTAAISTSKAMQRWTKQ